VVPVSRGSGELVNPVRTAEEALRQMTVYSEGKTLRAAAAAPRLES
jgi:hypothetical protein